MAALRNVYACLVHERPECVADLVRNLRSLDATSEIVLYNGGKDDALLSGFPFERYGAVVHPAPRPLEWGRLHDFALDCMRFCLDRSGFDTLTIVDSDQLALRPGYPERLASALEEKSGVGLFGSSPGPHPRTSKIGPVAAAHRERTLWSSWVRGFPGGEEKLFHWTFWPSTVFTADAARDLLRLLASDPKLQEILRQTRIWATEEVILPTLVALLGYEVAASPFSNDFVKYKQTYSRKQIEGALARPDVFWVHPVPRRYDDPLRKLIREHLGQGHGHDRDTAEAAPRAPEEEPGLLVTLPLLERVRKIPGWFEDEEADLLLAAAARALTDLPAPHTVVEIGSYCGRSTVLLGSAVRTLRPAGRVHAIDPHLGQVGALDQGLQSGAPTFEKLRESLAANGLGETVEIIRKCSFEVEWNGPISFLLIDGLHDYVNVARDFYHFEAAVVPGGYVAFHDYADYYPGVRSFVDEQLAAGAYRKVHLAKSLMVVRKLAAPTAATSAPVIAPAVSTTEPSRPPLVSCIMPTRDRRELVPQAIRQFLRQDWPEAELIIVDDGDDKVADLIPADLRIRYLALDERRTVGAKRNLACAEARGEIILHWDDDDWMADHRIRRQVEHLLAAKADLCGLPRLHFHEPATGRSWEFTSPARDKKWIAGATFCYRKEIWRATPFADVDNGEDTGFLWSDRPRKLKVAPLDDTSLYVARLHPGNTASRRDATNSWRLVKLKLDLGALSPPPPPAASVAPAAPVITVSAPPLVSCVMPTRGRPGLALQAIQYFLRQDYPERELVIVDDGAEPLAVPESGQIRYLRLPAPVSLGRKRNLGAEQSRGEIIVHWDDDDWYAPDRLRHQIRPLLAGEADLAGLTAEHFYSLQGGTFWSCTPELHARMFFADVHGRSLAYTRALWERRVRYPDVTQAEDARFLQAALGRGSRLARLPNPDKLIYVRHAANTWRFECGQYLQPAAWMMLEAPSFVPQEDLAFYRGLSI